MVESIAIIQLVIAHIIVVDHICAWFWADTMLVASAHVLGRPIHIVCLDIGSINIIIIVCCCLIFENIVILDDFVIAYYSGVFKMDYTIIRGCCCLGTLAIGRRFLLIITSFGVTWIDRMTFFRGWIVMKRVLFLYEWDRLRLCGTTTSIIIRIWRNKFWRTILYAFLWINFLSWLFTVPIVRVFA